MSRDSFCLLTTLVFVGYSKFLPSISLRKFVILPIPHSTIHHFHKNLHFGKKKSLTSAKKLHFVKKLHFDKKSSLWQKSLIPTKPLIWASFLSKWIFFVEVKLFPVEVSHCKRKSFLFFQPFLLHNDFDAIVFEIENLNLVLSFDLLDYIIILDLYIKSFLVIRTQ